MGATVHDALVLADANSGWLANLIESRAGAITLVGVSAVFCGLLLLMGFMRLLALLAGVRKPAVVADVSEVRGELVAETRESAVEEEELPEMPVAGPLSVPTASLAAAQVARTLFKTGRFPIGEAVEVIVDGRSHQVELVTVGLATTALVDDFKIVFYRARIAGKKARG